MKGFEGFVFDIDGTVVPDGALEVESDVIKDAFRALPDTVPAIAATGRTHDFALPITRQLSLVHDAVVTNGAAIMNSQTGHSYWEQHLSYEQVERILTSCKAYDHQLCIAGDPMGWIKTAAEQSPRPAGGVFLLNLSYQIAQEIMQEVSQIPDIYAYISEGWVADEIVFDVNIGHINARKDIALKRLLAKYALSPSNMVAVGDGLNDIDLFRVVGYRIAVANAHPQLIELADEVIPPQDEDGLAEVVRLFT